MSPVRSTVKELSFRAFLALDRVGIHVLPKHYYTPVPDQAWLRAHRELWRRPAELVAIGWDVDRQLAWLEEICSPYYGEVEGLATYAELTARGFGPGYGPIESQILHCFIRAERPRRVVEVGGGVSTATIARASDANVAEGADPIDLTTVEPFPSPALLALGVRVLRRPLQTVPDAVFDGLAAGDLLFIDSSHTLKTGSELHRLYLEIVPRLAPGVFVHVHDVYLPYLYAPSVLHQYFDPQETALVLALLCSNPHLEVVCCESALHHDRADALRAVLSDYRPEQLDRGLRPEGVRDGHFPSSLWLRTL